MTCFGKSNIKPILKLSFTQRKYVFNISLTPVSKLTTPSSYEVWNYTNITCERHTLF